MNIDLLKSLFPKSDIDKLLKESIEQDKLKAVVKGKATLGEFIASKVGEPFEEKS